MRLLSPAFGLPLSLKRLLLPTVLSVDTSAYAIRHDLSFWAAYAYCLRGGKESPARWATGNRKERSVKAPLLSLVVWLCLGCLPAFGWLRPTYEDAIVVERSELIVVAHIKDGSIKYVRHANKPGEGNSYEHHGILVITEVLKGKTDKKEIPVIIHYGLTPVVGGYVERDGFMINLRGWRKDYPKNIIEIMDTGNSATSLTPIVKDAREENLWFLRKKSGIYGRKPGTGNYGIVDPEDLRPASMKDYFKAYLSATPEKSVREYVAVHPEFADRAGLF